MDDEWEEVVSSSNHKPLGVSPHENSSSVQQCFSGRGRGWHHLTTTILSSENGKNVAESSPSSTGNVKVILAANRRQNAEPSAPASHNGFSNFTFPFDIMTQETDCTSNHRRPLSSPIDNETSPDGFRNNVERQACTVREKQPRAGCFVPLNSRICYKCNQIGHMRNECPKGSIFGVMDNNPVANQFGNRRQGSKQEIRQKPTKQQEIYVPNDGIEDEAELFKGISAGRNFQNFENVQLQVFGPDAPDHITSFETAGLHPLVLKNIQNSNYVTPTPIQKGAIAVILAKRDMIASAVTGSGKTAAFLIPVINMLLEQGIGLADGYSSRRSIQKPEVVILVPTRELAIQIYQQVRKFAHGSTLKAALVYGGASMEQQVSNLMDQRRCNILVATPGRLLHFLQLKTVDFSDLQVFIMDEADRMLDIGFSNELESIRNLSTMPPRGRRQTLMFSATFSGSVQQLASDYLEQNYLVVNTGAVGATNPDVHQEFFLVNRKDKRAKLMEILVEIDLQAAKILIFVETKISTDFLASYLCNNQLRATCIHSDRLQSQRENALHDFKNGTRNILVATSVAARGLDIEGVDYVINFDLPSDINEYVHRIGRTGRVGNDGRSISFFDPDRDTANAGKLIEVLIKSNSNIPMFIQQCVLGIGALKYNFNAPSTTNFICKDIRQFADAGQPVFGATNYRPSEYEETWE